jgi:hypothetical protein
LRIITLRSLDLYWANSAADTSYFSAPAIAPMDHMRARVGRDLAKLDTGAIHTSTGTTGPARNSVPRTRWCPSFFALR